MYNIGDKIVYPMHGAGVIESIEEKEILGKRQKYYVMKMPIGDMKVMIPMTNIKEIGIREIINQQEAEGVIQIFKSGKTDMCSNWNKRYRENMVKIKSGNIYEVADVVKNLMYRDKEKGLSTGERKMLNSAKQILISELVLAKGMKQSEIESMIEGMFNEI
ncbi:MAG: CarD family transcriptional regulator [Petroclostridium sp.]|jgi:CarD family transcriptional regulator|uniref:CarD family transcriptional regulator n=1 Tax=Petroclostridium xylanilyticum TaxID=1792311 RepID=UPI000B99173E|nr:CarD family transcriptional regulator [Petroclostridium xylanilyticum]MBZ4645660.1 CarD-like transcriptional regulator [Clostridia bacterium]MDK2809737.1 CarD family transcriptional regulator [Petroclostridium sp.]